MSQFKLELARRHAQKRQAQPDTIQKHLKILDKRNRLVPFTLNKAQQHLIDNLTGRDIIVKARQLGFSTVIRATHETKAMTQTARLATLAHDQNTTNLLRRMSRRFWENLPDSVRPNRSMDNAKTTIYSNTGSEVIIQTAGSSAGGRGGTLSDVHGSEVAFWQNADDNMAGIMQAVPLDGNIVLESTPNGASGWFYEACMQALDNNSVWKLHFYEWWWNDEYNIPLLDGESLTYTDEEQYLAERYNLTPEQIKWRRYKIKELPHKFKQEYPEDILSCFLTSGNSFFGDIEHVYIAQMDIKPQPNKRYIAGLDFGQDNDYTVMIVLDADTLQMVDMLRVNQLSWFDIRSHIKQRANYWNNCNILAEYNSIGSPNIEALQADGIHVTPFYTSAQNKPQLIQSLYTALHDNNLLLQDIPELKHELRNFISKQTPSGHWQYEGANGVHDDCVIALALAYLNLMRGSISIEAI